ncbi:MAG TPA: DUF4350 domain-containing protein [Polyangiales bacterium]
MRRSSRLHGLGRSRNTARERSLRRVAGCLALAGLIACAACAPGQPKAPPATVLFDEGHGQKFGADKSGELDLSGLAALVRNQGMLVRTTHDALTDSRLSGVDAVVISGPFVPLTAAESDALLHFLERGGRLCVMLHIAPPMGDFLHRLEVSISNGVIREREGVIDDDPLSFQVSRLSPHELTKNVTAFNVHGAWALLNTADNASLTAETGPTAWVDLNADQKLGEGDAVQAFGVVATGHHGKGGFVVFGDDAIFQNRFLIGGNAVLGKNLAAWLGQGSARAASQSGS